MFRRVEETIVHVVETPDAYVEETVVHVVGTLWPLDAETVGRVAETLPRQNSSKTYHQRTTDVPFMLGSKTLLANSQSKLETESPPSCELPSPSI